MLNRTKEKRLKICNDLNEKMLKQLYDLSISLDYPQSRMVEDGIKYVLKKKLVPTERNAIRRDITLTINHKLWLEFQNYADSKRIKLVYLLEAGIKYAIKKYKRKLKIGNL